MSQSVKRTSTSGKLHQPEPNSCLLHFPMAGFKMSVQPPRRMQANSYLYPPVMAKQSLRAADGSVDYFATATVIDRQGSVLDGCLQGTKAVSRFEIAGSKPGSRSFVFPFTDLSISYPGTYTVRIDIYQYMPGDYAGAALIDQLYSKSISVTDTPTPRESPSSDERLVLRKAREAGIPVQTS
ncbi:hypothetical protein CDD80_6825 [Ophiocordyceps camponoti-rufipedis]|uniref:Velvet domain-containing protein n=1 Tax=Ophiocordyceps camponoti-rufipedis TaxID=2004952 RepID=A0A2C5YP85_9HYPO|nr:hypothetical protein CDD80_6825 [Ophiocordyceps camponoti-rufipedis]